MAASEFAKRQLKKHGWTEGSGLGKQENGRSEPIKVSLKMDKTGVGHDPGKDFTDHWWLRVFNEAAQKIGKKKQNDLVTNDDGDSRQKKMEECKNNLYKGFVKSATLTNGIEEKHSDSSSDDSSDQDDNTRLPTLNDIHKFCGGATGHKAARFGIKMGGKLARVAEYDKMFEEMLEKEKLPTSVSKKSCISNDLPDPVEQKQSVTCIGSPSSGDICGSGDDSRRKKKKHKKHKKEKHLEVADSASKCFNEGVMSGPDEIVNDPLTETVCQNNRIKKKHRKRKDNADNDDVVDTVSEVSPNNETNQETKNKKKHKRSRVKMDSVYENDTQDKKSKKKMKTTDKHICTDELFQKCDSDGVKLKKKKRKKNKE